MKPKLLFDKDKWLFGENIPDCDIYFFQVPASCFASDWSYDFIKRYKKFLGLYKGFTLDFYVGEKDSNEVAESIIRALLERPKFGKELDRNIISWSHKLILFSKKLDKLPLEKYNNKQLWKLYKDTDKLQTKLYTYGWIPVAADLFHNNFTNKLKSYLYAVSNSKEEAEQAFVVLTTPSRKTIVADERKDFLVIHEKYKKFLKARTIPQHLKDALTKHAQKWGHLGYIYAGNVDPFGVDHYLKELFELAKTGINTKKILAKQEQYLKTAREKQKKIYKKLKVSVQYKRLFENAKDFALSKLIRRNAQLLNLYFVHKTLLKEIAKRLGISRYQLQFMLQAEVKDALLNGRIDKNILSIRLKHCVLYTEEGFETVYMGAMEKKLRSMVATKINKNVKEFTGQTVQPGYAKGTVKIIIRAKDMPKMKQGDILVSIATDVDVVPAMKKAAAIITEQGGITSHAAIVSRELGTPCIIGTKIATKVLKDGDKVEVDANKGIVRKL
ncbi:MAG: hypothetical protein A3I07_00515 [Candidatus Doudnabacteria bacterium RIFCSPLOWO2_02_FULL_42_9]|uniref:PEP-utilising enzyme mobile domain-containing protein n=1 Tax=Candidatus Doudnabacteria bacterium RIFCSPHIGHO2_01_FULL_41_86 TaxID=1817821 RepID=A0A1F5NA01_9BACT|nr:MAG: hypothetical protein A2717_01840 [Candidatus Doudnabacteria bacterium RIFCSPHIGHO2_01_FULL_41_86]OGE74984.1 MAG: hypothetical protein A3K07_04410 [Candidatus Doudnabacteria bacterium RIFCSPHIGHO2_01_43_10]OGE85309.1 MAG: hypothetical protein A3E28_01410 [Candidatus Doudnabacteria bacterium RIFCSPHIGHO2_12_FULL_42_22]OGE86847.1 MAG: hypothetical protein A3C49_02245 [Candidatus Doudnabacteria bacterium RIFCSPHIGHO2_02_FULL_42_25]OGE91508.1 MAG: hypothetical protein A3K08_02820 [Candidatus